MHNSLSSSDFARPAVPRDLASDQKSTPSDSPRAIVLHPGASAAPHPPSAATTRHARPEESKALAAHAAPGARAASPAQAIQLGPLVSNGTEPASELDKAVATIRTAHRRLKAVLYDRGGQVSFPKPRDLARGGEPGDESPLPPETRHLFSRLDYLYQQMDVSIRMLEGRGMEAASARELAGKRFADQAEKVLKSADMRWRAVADGYPRDGTGGLIFGAPSPEESDASGQGVSGLGALSLDDVVVAWEVVQKELTPLLKERAAFLDESRRHHPLYLPRMLQTKALCWDAAAQTLDAVLGGRDLKSYRVTAHAPSGAPSEAAKTLPAPPTERKYSLSEDSGDLPAPAPSEAEREQKHAPGRTGWGRVPVAARREPSVAPPLHRSSASAPIEIFRKRSQALLAQAREKGSEHLADPGAVLGVGLEPTWKKEFGKKLKATVGEMLKRHEKAPALASSPLESGRGVRLPVEIDTILKEGKFPTHAFMDEKKFALACVQQAVRSARNAQAELMPSAATGLTEVAREWPTDAAIEKAFNRVYSQMLSQRSNDVVKTTVVVPLAGAPSRFGGHTVPRQIAVDCEQRPAVAVTDTLRAAYLADGVEGAHCHERTQHKHAVTLFVSRMKINGANQLTLTRHGVLSANQLGWWGVRKLSDSDLGRVGVDLADALAAPPFNDKRLQNAVNNEGLESDAQRFAAAASLIRDGAAPWQRIPSWLRGGRPPLVDLVRRAASLQRAREAAAAAMASLPDDELIKMVKESGGGTQPVRMRLASVSLMTPDSPRSWLFTKPQNDELAMWHDQRQAWKDLAAMDQAMPMPKLDGKGQLIRDEEGRLVMDASEGDGAPVRKMQVKFTVAALNVPVNEFGTAGKLAAGVLRSHANAAADNRAALNNLLGRNLPAWAAWKLTEPLTFPLGTPGALRDRLENAAVSHQEKVILCTLAAQIAAIYTTGAQMSAGNDPYKLATRLIVLASRLERTATLVNCKSGKDRTSAAETEARQMALVIAQTGKVPPLGAPVTTILRTQLSAIHEAGGSRQVQTWNTGMGGTKLKGASLFDRMGVRGKDQRISFQGLSKYTAS